MPRKHRHEEPGCYYHVTTRGNDRQLIRLDEFDCLIWETMLGRVARVCGWDVFSWCLMKNHFHLVIQIHDVNLSKGMQMLNGGYARTFNEKHGRQDHLFGKRFWSKPIGTRAYLLGSLHYIAWNPVLVGDADAPGEFPWCSDAVVSGRRDTPTFLAVDSLLELFGPDPTAARAAYLGHVRSRHAPVPGTVTGL